MKQRYLAIDFGEKRLGIAISDPLGLTAQPQPYIVNGPDMFRNIQTLIDEFNIGTVVCGLPQNRDGEDTQKTKEVRAFVSELETHIDCPICFQDERYSTKAVTRHLIDADVSRKKRKEVVDSMAAAFFLQGFMDRLPQK